MSYWCTMSQKPKLGVLSAVYIQHVSMYIQQISGTDRAKSIKDNNNRVDKH